MNCRLAGKWPGRCIVIGAAVAATFVCAGQALAKPGGEPLVLDSQTGIHSGVPGTVLQSGSLGGPGMVHAQPMATLPELPQQEQMPIMVSPYVQYGGQTSGQSTQPYQPQGYGYGQPGYNRLSRPPSR
jgi:hypothetical protein